ncbi:MAG TPA: hypothetical protein VFT50_14175 [Baekduia sp.]|nr:hypothetical protein [Baekduia sp.]
MSALPFDRMVNVAIRARVLWLINEARRQCEAADSPLDALVPEFGALDHVLFVFGREDRDPAKGRERDLAALAYKLDDAFARKRGAGRLLFATVADAVAIYDLDGVLALTHSLRHEYRDAIRDWLSTDTEWGQYVGESWEQVAGLVAQIEALGPIKRRTVLDVWRDLPDWLLDVLPRRYRPQPLFLEEIA